MPPSVKMIGIHKSFPGVHALKGLDLTVETGEIHGLLGENGAGKSVLLKTLLGVYKPDAGEMYLFGEKITVSGPLEARELGLSAVYQDLMLAPNLSVAENICLGQQPNTHGILNAKEMKKRAKEALGRLKIDIDINAKVGSLIVAKRQMVAIAKAMLNNAKVLILDEPTAMLTSEETRLLFDAMHMLKSKGVSIIYVSHRMEEIFEMCDRVTVLRDGENVGDLDVDKTDEDELVRLMAGRELNNIYEDESDMRKIGEEVLSVNELTKEGVFRNISFQVHRSEIVGVYGLVGSGRSDVMMALYGANKFDSGSILLDGKPYQAANVSNAIASGIALVPEDRLKEGIAGILTVKENINLAGYNKISKYGVISSRKGKVIAENYVERLKIKTPGTEQRVQNLSGGNQQKVVISRLLNLNPKLLIFDEPTIGIDVNAKFEIYKLIRSLAQSGVGIIFVSSYLPELLGIADCIIVMNNGRITGKIGREEATSENVLSLCFK